MAALADEEGDSNIEPEDEVRPKIPRRGLMTRTYDQAVLFNTDHTAYVHHKAKDLKDAATLLEFTEQDVSVLKFFLNIFRLPQGPSPWFYRCNEKTNGKGKQIKSSNGAYLAGFDSYNQVHWGDVPPPKSKRNELQRKGTLAFDGWDTWRDSFPASVLPPGVQSSAWCASVSELLTRALRDTLHHRGQHYDERIFVSHMHVLDQAVTGTKFVWHQDHEENNVRRCILWSMVILLEQDKYGKSASMQIAGAVPVDYPRAGCARVFDARLCHSTVEGTDGGVKLGAFFAVPW